MALSAKTKRWLFKNCRADFKNKTVLITGANSGVGFKSAEIMAYLGARVILACRSNERANAAKAALLRDYPAAHIETLPLDLANLPSVDAFVSRIKESRTDIDVFLNNAGVFRKPHMTTGDGFELVLGTNYLGVYYLTESILPYLAALPHEVIYINTVSIIHKIGKIDYNDFFFEKRCNDFSVYARSKLCLAKYTYYKSRQYENSRVRILMNHPGIAITPLGADAFGKTVKFLSKIFSWLFNSAEKSALSLPFIAANVPPAGSISGPRGFLHGWGYPAVNKTCRKVQTGGEELIEFTDKQIAGVKARANSD